MIYQKRRTNSNEKRNFQKKSNYMEWKQSNDWRRDSVHKKYKNKRT